MTMVVHNISKVPSEKFAWYVWYLDDRFEDEFREQLANNFNHLGAEAGEDTLVVRGHDPGQINEDVQIAYKLTEDEKVDPPALLVTNTAPEKLDEAGDDHMVMVFQLTTIKDRIREEDLSIADFLSALVRALKDPNSADALRNMEPGVLERTWGWITQYVSLEPGMFGCSINLKPVFKRLSGKIDRIL